VLAEAIKTLEEMTSGAASRAYSLLQKASKHRVALQTSADLAGFEVLTLINRMAKMHHSAALAQLGSRINAVIHYGTNTGEDIFAKVKGLIRDLIIKLDEEAQAAATEKAFCDENLPETESKEADMEEQIQVLKARLDRDSARFAEIKEDISHLQSQLATIAKAQAEMDKIREEEHTAFVAAKNDLEIGIDGVRKAINLLKDYFAEKDSEQASTPPADDAEGPMLLQFARQPSPPEIHHKSRDGAAAAGIIDVLEMLESDFATSLTKEQTGEASAQSEYEKESNSNQVEKSELEYEVKFKSRFYKALDKTIAQVSSDLDSAKSENSAILEFSAKIKDKCIAESTSYEEIRRRRKTEITGLKEALEILKNDAALFQRKRHGNRLRGQHSKA